MNTQQSRRVKMYKSKKQWLIAAATTSSVLFGISIVSVSADQTSQQPSNSSVSVTQSVSKTSLVNATSTSSVSPNTSSTAVVNSTTSPSQESAANALPLDVADDTAIVADSSSSPYAEMTIGPEDDSSYTDDNYQENSVDQNATSAQNQTIPTGWQAITPSFMVDESRHIYYSTEHTIYGQAADQAANFWNKQIGETVLVKASSVHPANVALADYHDSILSTLATTGNDGSMLINQSLIEDEGYNAFNVIAHEFGHTLGLEHSPYSGDLMYALVPRGSITTLSTYDKAALKQSMNRWSEPADLVAKHMSFVAYAQTDRLPTTTQLSDDIFTRWRSVRSLLNTALSTALAIKNPSSQLLSAIKAGKTIVSTLTKVGVTDINVVKSEIALLNLYGTLNSSIALSSLKLTNSEIITDLANAFKSSSTLVINRTLFIEVAKAVNTNLKNSLKKTLSDSQLTALADKTFGKVTTPPTQTSSPTNTGTQTKPSTTPPVTKPVSTTTITTGTPPKNSQTNSTSGQKNQTSIPNTPVVDQGGHTTTLPKTGTDLSTKTPQTSQITKHKQTNKNLAASGSISQSKASVSLTTNNEATTPASSKVIEVDIAPSTTTQHSNATSHQQLPQTGEFKTAVFSYFTGLISLMSLIAIAVRKRWN